MGCPPFRILLCYGYRWWVVSQTHSNSSARHSQANRERMRGRPLIAQPKSGAWTRTTMPFAHVSSDNDTSCPKKPLIPIWTVERKRLRRPHP